MAKGNGGKTKMAVQIGQLETTCEFIKKELGELGTGQTIIANKIDALSTQVTVNKTKLALWGTLGGILDGGAVTLLVILLTRVL